MVSSFVGGCVSGQGVKVLPFFAAVVASHFLPRTAGIEVNAAALNLFAVAVWALVPTVFNVLLVRVHGLPFRV
jgi:hypothetical protein